MQTRQQKETIIKEISDRLAKTKTAAFADYTGIDVAKMTDLRRRLRDQDGELKVAKKTLVDLAFKKAGFEGINTKKMSGQLAVIFSYRDEVAPIKILADFAKKESQLKILGGILENKFIEAASVLNLAKLPSKQELLANLVGSLSAPLSGIVNVLQGNLRGLLQVLTQIKNNKNN